MSTATTVMTMDDFWNLPKDGKRHELVKGELFTMPPPGFEHGKVGNKLNVRMYVHSETFKLGDVVIEVGFVLERDPDTVRAPDIAFVGASKIQKHGSPRKYFPEPPDVAVEVISPNDTYVEVDEKVQEWLAAGTLAVWVVNPRRKSVAIHAAGQNPVVLKESDTLVGDSAFPGFSMPVSEIFV